VALTKPYHFIPIEQIVAAHLDLLFPGLEVKGAYAFRVTRNADIEIQEDEAEDLLLTIKQELSRRRFGEVVRLEVDPLMPDSLLKDQLLDFLELSEDFVYPVPGLLDLSSLWGLVGLDFPHLKDAPFQPRPHERLGEGVNIFEEIQRGDILLHHPYQSFTSSVEYFIRSAMADPQVLAIKQTLYRTGGDSALIQALMAAAENGKQVAVLVELKARFDEANNITWAEALEKAGVHVVYGLLGLKTHAKVALVVRQEAEGLRRYIHIGTGNYNAKTARIYTDMGLLTCDPEVGADATDLFNYLTGYSLFKTYRKLLVAPLTLRESLVQLIQREMNLHCPERPGQIMIKLNSLVDPELIQVLYQASERGVEIDLIIRGICCLRPGVAGVSDNIRVISIIGRFLEHSRVLYLHNGGNEEVYIGSADWMTRNLDKRVEVMVPVADAQLKQKVIKVLRDSMRDNRQSWLLQEDGSYQARQPLDGEEEFSLQANLLL
jgi:polyphosphate kinase